MPLTYSLVDAFTQRPFAGNPAVVYVLQRWPSDDWLQCVAREMNQSETAFVVAEGDGFRLRWFTPLVEVDLCGHATLAAAHTLWSCGIAGKGRPIAFTTRSGVLTAAQAGDIVELDFPLLPEQPADPPKELAETLGVSPIYCGQSRHDLVVEVASAAEVRLARPDFVRLTQIATRGVILTARSSDRQFDFVSRFFAP